MYILKEFQEKAVKSLLAHTFDTINTVPTQIPILLEAPTGSGKTVMMASYLERLVEELPLQPGLHGNVAFIWFAPNTLHIQSFISLQKLYSDTKKLNCIDLSDLSGNPVLNPKDLLFVNWSSVDGMKKIWRKENESNTNLETLIENTKSNGTQLILVIDEAHLSAFTGTQAISVRRLINAKIEVLVTATPRTRPQRSIFISRQEVINEQGNANRRVENSEWEVPGIRYYNDLFNREEITSHALEPFFEYKNASTPETDFKKFLLKNEDGIDWWYKNGDQGKEHFAVPYTDNFGVLRLFFVDFVIKFKSGKVGLFDTKTKRSDAEAPNKHNALLTYIEYENASHPERTLVGGVLIPTETNGIISFKYSSRPITDTNDLTGWEYFNPANH